MKHLSLLITTLCLIWPATLLAQHSQRAFKLSETQRVVFSTKQNALTLLIEDHLMKQFPDYSDSPPAHVVGFADVNGDSTPEVFVHVNDEYNFCDADYTCQTYIYAYEGTSLIQIGHLQTGGEVRLLQDTTNNIKNLIASGKNKGYDLYTWSDNQYKRVGP